MLTLLHVVIVVVVALLMLVVVVVVAVTVAVCVMQMQHTIALGTRPGTPGVYAMLFVMLCLGSFSLSVVALCFALVL